jgi:hypothetical protein
MEPQLRTQPCTVGILHLPFRSLSFIKSIMYNFNSTHMSCVCYIYCSRYTEPLSTSFQQLSISYSYYISVHNLLYTPGWKTQNTKTCQVSYKRQMSSATTTSPDMCSPNYTYTSRVETKTSKFPQKTKKTKKKRSNFDPN